MRLPMFCNQCEQTLRGDSCTDIGVCGKDPVVESLQKLLLYGLKGLAAYKAHARRLGKTDPEVEAFIEEALFATVTNVNFDAEALLNMCLECGRMNYRTMELLNAAHVERLGTPSPTTVREGLEAGPAILVTGHDLEDLRKLLEYTRGRGVSVYTHGEMLPAHMYEGLREFEHLAGHYGGAWQKQRREFSRFKGPILATTNCVLIPTSHNDYLGRLWTIRSTGIPGANHIVDGDFEPLVQQALQLGDLEPTEHRQSTVGHHYTHVLGQLDTVIDAVKEGTLRRMFVIGGCDGAELGRNYYTEFAQNAPQDTVIMTLGCGKYRIRNHDYGQIGQLPRLLDLGQCNDSYGAIQIAVALAEAFDCGVNDLPLTIVLSWFEQKAIAVLLTLLHLGIKDIRVGPRLPAFIHPKVLEILVERYNLQELGSRGKDDVEALMATG